jgi:Uma2 family endonuclease
MKTLIIEALDKAFESLIKNVPLTKKKTEYVSIIDVNPLELTKFMKKNKIPKDASFGGRENGYDGWDDICLVWEVDVPTTETDRLKYKKERFTNIAFQSVRELLLINNYKRVGYNTRHLNEFRDTTVYDMYINKEFDRLVRYYSLPFSLFHIKLN